jgi:hypothetical protein
MGIETAQCKCVSRGPGQRTGPLGIIRCGLARMLPSAHTLPAGVGRRRRAGVPVGLAGGAWAGAGPGGDGTG